MATWSCHISRLERKYDKEFSKYPIFRADLVDSMNKQVQVFLHLCNTTDIEYIELGALFEFRSLQKRIERGEWLRTTHVWVDQPALKEE